jgi:hypothetical protein
MELELNAQCTLRKSWYINGHPLVACSVATTFIALPFSQHHTVHWRKLFTKGWKFVMDQTWCQLLMCDYWKEVKTVALICYSWSFVLVEKLGETFECDLDYLGQKPDLQFSFNREDIMYSYKKGHCVVCAMVYINTTISLMDIYII